MSKWATSPIGLFDSGIGGTSIWKEIHRILPNEQTVFLADSANAPYGIKSKEEIIALSCKNTEYLLEQNCKLIVVACNTATTNAIGHLRAKYDVPFIGIEPAIKPAAIQSEANRIGVLATKGTLSSELFHQKVENFHDTVIIEQVGTGLVDLIENGKMYSPEMDALLEKYIQPFIAEKIDYLVLGCTHYPYLIPQIQKLLPKNIHIIDSGLAVAKQTKRVLEQLNLLNPLEGTKNNVFYTNADPTVLKSLLPDTVTVQKNAF